MPMPQEGSRLKYKSTGIFFEVKKITNQFVILNSMDGSRQIMTGKQNLTTLFEPEEVPPAEATQEDTD
jgi:hypothetical protein